MSIRTNLRRETILYDLVLQSQLRHESERLDTRVRVHGALAIGAVSVCREEIPSCGVEVVREVRQLGIRLTRHDEPIDLARLGDLLRVDLQLLHGLGDGLGEAVVDGHDAGARCDGQTHELALYLRFHVRRVDVCNRVRADILSHFIDRVGAHVVQNPAGSDHGDIGGLAASERCRQLVLQVGPADGNDLNLRVG